MTAFLSENLDLYFKTFGIEIQKGEVGSEVPINAIFDAPTVEVTDGYAIVLTPQPQIACKTSDIEDVIEGTRFVVESREYTALEPNDDGTGVSTVRLLRAS